MCGRWENEVAYSQHPRNNQEFRDRIQCRIRVHTSVHRIVVLDVVYDDHRRYIDATSDDPMDILFHHHEGEEASQKNLG